ncbi:MAG: hypothetical protein ACI4OY_04150, partial [Aristaeellaceae bacterium]
FGCKDEKNMQRRIILGWTNLSSVAQLRGGESAGPTTSPAFPRKEEGQDCCPEVRGPVITLPQHGRRYSSAVLRQPDMKPFSPPPAPTVPPVT